MCSIEADFIRYHVPEHLQSHIDYITPGLKLTPVVKRTVKHKRSTELAPGNLQRKNGPKKGGDRDWHYTCPAADNLPADVQGCGVNITYACWKALYKLPDVIPTLTKGNSLGLFEQGDYFAESDVDSYWAEFSPFVPQGKPPVR